MIPYSYNMVDMGGIDLVEVNGSVVPGIYEKIYDAANDCGDVVLYNWKFAGIDITPQYTQILVSDPIVINGVIQVTELDQIIIVGVGPEPPVLVPLSLTENGAYLPSSYDADGFNRVDVAVPIPPEKILVPLYVTSDGIYDPADYQADGFSSVEVAVAPPVTVRDACLVSTVSTAGTDASVSIQPGTYEGTTFTPSGEAVNILYRNAASPITVGIVSIRYGSSNWTLTAMVPVVYNGDLFNTGETIRAWRYTETVSFYVISKN